MVERFAWAGGAPESFDAYLVPWKSYRLSTPSGPLVASIASLFIERANELVKIHQPIGLEQDVVQSLVGKLVDLSLDAWNNAVAGFKIVE